MLSRPIRDSTLQFRVLGPLEVLRDGAPVRIGGPRPRTLLALLLLDVGRVVSVDQIIEAVWVDRPPETAAHAVEVHVSQLRKALEPARSGGRTSAVLVTQAPGYVLDVPADEIDAFLFRSLAERGGSALLRGDHEVAGSLLGDALALWRGPALQDFAYQPFA